MAALTFAAAGCRDRDNFKLPAPGSSGGAQAPAPRIETNTYAGVVEQVAPAVVTIRAASRVRAPQQHPFVDDPFFREFFGDRLPQMQPREQIRQGLGSGVIISPDGHVVTNHHVVDGAEDIKVELPDRRTFDAKLIGSDPPSDLAVLKIDAQGLPVLALGDSDRVRVGDIVLAVGNPLNVGQTVTMGIISAKGRATGLSDGSFEDFLQTDAPINQGNSGGALVNTQGEVIGINSQIVSGMGGGNIGIGFAIPSNMARTVVEQLISSGRVRRGQLGVTVQPVTADLAASLGLREARGVIVNQVLPGSAADRAGLRQGDVIVALNGEPVNEPNLLRNRVAGSAPGTEVTLTVVREGREQEMKVTLGEFQDRASAEPRRGGDEGDAEGGGRLGITASPLTPELAARLRLPEGANGLVVTGVDPGGPAAEAGIRQGDLIIEANRRPVRSVDDLREAIRQSGDRPVLLLVSRGGQTSFIPIRPRG